MKVAGLNADGDWRFGRGLASYRIKAEAVRQNVATRVRSFTNDWFLDVTANIDWITLLGSRNTQTTIEREVERVILSTVGVARIDNLQTVVDRKSRALTIITKITTIYDTQFTEEIGINL